jgi:ribonucleoside-diphosphate reductase alpha chain
MVSLAWRKGCDSAEVIKELGGIACHSPAGFGDDKVLSCADAVAKAIKAHIVKE